MVYCVYYVHRALNGRYVTWLPGAPVKCWMPLNVYTLPQLAVSAKILCLLMVVICGAVPSMVRSVRLFSSCSHHYLDIYHNGTVMAVAAPKDLPILRMSTQDFDLKLLIYSPKASRYLCFTRKKWKLFGLPISKEEALRRPRCQFRETMSEGYNVYTSVADPRRYIGFNARGAPVRQRVLPPEKQECATFIKMDPQFSINQHNAKVGGDLPATTERGRRPPRRRHPRPHRLKPGCPDNLRHAKSKHRRKNCLGN